MIIELLLPVFERVTNWALARDPVALEKLSGIHDQIIHIECTDWQISFYLIASKTGLHFEKKTPGHIDVTLKSTLSNFLQLLSKGVDTAALFQHPIDISGNTHTIEILRDVFKQLNIEWEEELSHFIGDALAHKVCFYTKEVNDIAKNTEQKLKMNLQEYLHFEAKLLPTKTQIESFYTDIATLKNDVDRLEARIQEMISKGSAKND